MPWRRCDGTVSARIAMDRADVIILGGGLVGLTLASALDSSGLSAILIDPADPERERQLRPSTAAPAPSRRARMRMLETIGVADHFPEPGCPIRTIQVADGLQPGGLAFEPDDDEPLGFMHENRHLRAALQARAEAGRSLWLLWKSTPQSSSAGRTALSFRWRTGASFSAPVLAAVDGRNSPMREAAGIPIARWKYDHMAIVSTLRHERPHDNIA